MAAKARRDMARDPGFRRRQPERRRKSVDGVFSKLLDNKEVGRGQGEARRECGELLLSRATRPVSVVRDIARRVVINDVLVACRCGCADREGGWRQGSIGSR